MIIILVSFISNIFVYYLHVQNIHVMCIVLEQDYSKQATCDFLKHIYNNLQKMLWIAYIDKRCL